MWLSNTALERPRTKGVVGSSAVLCAPLNAASPGGIWDEGRRT